MIKLLILLTALNCSAQDIEFYKQLFGSNVYTRLTDNAGKGYSVIEGTRNFRVVLPGVLYRSGKINPAGNENPMTEPTLNNLCGLGFSTSVYLYTTNYNTVPHVIKCQNTTLNYKQISVLSNPLPVLKLVYRRIKGELSGPILTHCYNGWHASGYASATALMQFCDWKPADAWEYWKRNVDGSVDYPSIKSKILNFKRYTGLDISESEKKLICP